MKRPWYLRVLRWARRIVQIIDQIEEAAGKSENVAPSGTDKRDPQLWEPGGAERYCRALEECKLGDKLMLRTPYGRGVVFRAVATDDLVPLEQQRELRTEYGARLKEPPGE